MLRFLYCEVLKVKILMERQNTHNPMLENLKPLGKKKSAMMKMTRIEKNVSEKRKCFLESHGNDGIMRANGSKQHPV